jgi:signal transduction histidine kinase
MKAIQLRAPGGLDQLELVDLPDPGSPGPGEIRVRLHASSLNFHDLSVVAGYMPSADRRIPMPDGAGVIEVRDFGPGLPPEELDNVFRPFYRAPGARAGEAWGVGLGLATVRSIMRAHGGDVCLSSNNGLIAEVRLPVAA